MTKAELIDIVANETGNTKANTDAVIKATFKAIQEALAEGEKFQYIGFGTFSVKTRPARMGLNPRTKEKVSIPESKAVKFSAAKTLKESLK